MDSRKDAFIRKFSDARQYLGSNSISDIVSIKYRENVGYSAYDELISVFLQGRMNLEAKEVKGDFRGRAWLIQDSDQHRVLLVEHETGLEILYIASSIASLLSLIPLINSVWKFLRSRFSNRHFPPDRGDGLEIRLIDNKNQLLERHLLAVEDYVLEECMKEIMALTARIEKLEQALEKRDKKNAKSKKPIRRAQNSKKRSV